MATSKTTRLAYVLFPVALVWFIAGTVLGWTIHWSSWLLLGAVSLMLVSNFVRPRASEFLTIGSATLMLVSLVGMLASKVQ